MSLRIYGNRQLKTLPGQATRPTPARVREALFNIWQGDMKGCRWLDLCTGSGAMGAEALCRGAFLAIGIEQSNRACAVIQQNWQQVARPDQRFQIIRGDVLKKLPTLAGQQFDRIYFDPPYASELYQPVLEAIAQHNLLASDGELAAEHSPAYLKEVDMVAIATAIPSLQMCRYKSYGNTALAFYRCRHIG
ncbi:MAG TPA: 16S rRNA (guanine(966)-N(2))-methyltransferase RsmD [Crinalium sp.]|jgi:16S rRNA (guanine(966)-N(2))-methyltransferase RsmD